MKTANGVLGDLADTLGSNAGSLIQQSLSSKNFLNECLSSKDHLIKESAEWYRSCRCTINLVIHVLCMELKY
ncbi:Importin subunit beta-1 [Camellia lanceoleosa]|uniref:Importin subunit beta-1 n=1 Tax=Camellia lanceoleosa TaxID=1840588 RepID=A0ACC0G9Y9_9ERIC|nr:Importin subunit beta-1 [Camellia lanceoleosa]